MRTPLMFTLAQDWMHRIWFRQYTPNSALGADTDNLYVFIVWVSLISFVVVIGLMLLFVVKYRRRPGPGTAGGYQVSVQHNTALELAWSIVPLLVMVVIFFWGFNGYVRKAVAPGNAEEIRLNGQQWNWTATYSNGKEPTDFKKTGNKESVVIPVPAGRPVRFIMTSSDVIHSFFVPAMRTKFDVIPNRYTSMWFTAERIEDNEVFCAEYCGTDHSEMAAWIRVMPAAEFDTWKATEKKFDDCVEWGRYLYRSKGCIACHSLDGKAGTGPTWKNMYGHEVEFTDGSKLSAADSLDPVKFANYVRESILDPKARIVQGFGPNMNSYQGLITQEQIDAIICFLKSPEMSDKSPQGFNPAIGDQSAEKK
ncbi:MAG: cytochrome c oxidase subunit II [Phycisphaeraceae bacterium]|nr:cytochrome c oxidase subunit II [Phycisphaeraceae bacterium]